MANPLSFAAGWEVFKETAGPLLVSEIAAQSPVGDGEGAGTLRDSHSWQSGDGGRLEIVSKDTRGPIAAYVIRGTRPHPIDPVRASVLHWTGDGGDVFARHVDHPGTQPNPFNKAAWDARRPEIIALFKATAGRGAVLSLLNPWKNKKL